MANVTALFWDVGGVMLRNGWDEESRRKAVGKHKLDWAEFEDRHERFVAALETGQIALDEYLEQTVFYRQRSFTKREFEDFIFSLSEPFPKTLGIVQRLAQSKKLVLAILNNESLDLNLYRIDRFGLRDYFSAFFSSCFLGARKPDEAIYRMALQITQRSPQESVFIDDRVPNLEGARRCGMRAIHFQNATQLEQDLRALDIEF